MKDKLLRFIRWFEPLVTELNQTTHCREASKGAIMGWLTFALDAGAVVFIVRKQATVPHADLIFNFLEVITLFILTYMFSHKVIMLKSKATQMLGLDGNGGCDGDPSKAAEPQV